MLNLRNLLLNQIFNISNTTQKTSEKNYRHDLNSIPVLYMGRGLR